MEAQGEADVNRLYERERPRFWALVASFLALIGGAFVLVSSTSGSTLSPLTITAESRTFVPGASVPSGKLQPKVKGRQMVETGSLKVVLQPKLGPHHPAEFHSNRKRILGDGTTYHLSDGIVIPAMPKIEWKPFPIARPYSDGASPEASGDLEPSFFNTSNSSNSSASSAEDSGS